MLTGEKPFTANTVTTIIYKIINEVPPPPRELDVSISAGMSAVIAKAMAKSPDERYQSGSAMAAALEDSVHAVQRTCWEPRMERR